MKAGELKIIKNNTVALLMEERHMVDSDIEQVISNAEVSEEKLYQLGQNRYLGKAILPNATFYVEYSVTSDGYEVHTAYYHRAKIGAG